MTDLLIRIGFGNLCISIALAMVAWAVQTTRKWPLVAHLLWLAVLVKLVTPPIVTVPLIPVPPLLATPARTAGDLGGLASSTAISTVTGSSLTEDVRAGVILLWGLGSVCVLAWSLMRIYRFHRLLEIASELAAPEVQHLATEIGQRLGLATTPVIYTMVARLSPMVWWVGGRVRIVIPAALPREVAAGDLRWILAHELAHVRRRDYLVRWLEWLACVGFWWNPVAWWARRNLRINEEICCDALVLSSCEPRPRTYASALMAAAEFLAAPALRPPAMASEINSGGVLERRFRMIVSSDRLAKTPRWLLGGALLLALGVIPLGVAYAQDFEAVERRLGEAVSKGELSLDQAKVMMDALRRVAPEDNRKSRRITREEYARSEREIMRAVAEGKISEEGACIRLHGLRKAMASQGERGEGRGRMRQIDPATLREGPVRAVEEGKITGKETKADRRELRPLILVPSPPIERLQLLEEADSVGRRVNGVWVRQVLTPISEKPWTLVEPSKHSRVRAGARQGSSGPRARQIGREKGRGR